MIPKRETNHQHLTIQVPDLMNSVSSQGSISNFVAQTPKQNRLLTNFKRAPNITTKANDQKENISSPTNNISNNQLLQLSKQNNNNNKLPYKMVTSQMPAPCLNHKDKQSSFYIQSDQSDGRELIFYCEKCAILVASQGFQVKRIQSNLKERTSYVSNSQGGSVKFSIKDTRTVKKSKVSQSTITRQQKETQLTNFLNDLQRIQSRIDKAFEINQSSLQEIDQTILTQSTKIKELFSSLHKILEHLQQRSLQQLDKKCFQLRQPIQTITQQLSSDTSTLQLMKEDICQAYDDIINETTGDEFGTVMDVYRQNLDEIQSALRKDSQENRNLGGYKILIEADMIKGQDILREIQKQVVLRVDSTRRQSIKSTKNYRTSFPLASRNPQNQGIEARGPRIL